jgi:cysteine-rich repeat protein
MRKTIAMLVFLTIGTGAVGTAALDNIRFQGSDALLELTRSVLANCPGADPDPADQFGAPWNGVGLHDDGTGSANAEDRMRTSAQTVAPMSRFLTLAPLVSSTTSCPTTPPAMPATSEGIVFGLDGIAVVASALNGAACNGSVEDCDRTTEPTAGLGYAKTITLADASTYTFRDWRDVLRVLYAGMDHDGGSDIANRRCNSLVRQAVANDWSNIFEGACSTCTQVEHVFRPDDASGTTQTLVSLLGLPTITYGNVGSIRTPFCNAVQISEPLPPLVNRYPPDFQDNDPIRRPCTGTNKGVVPPNEPTKQVCSAKGNLGLALTLTATSFLESGDAFPAVPCAPGYFIFGAAPKQLNASGTGLTTVGVRCPNGDRNILAGICLLPTTETFDPRCLAGINSKPAFIFDNTPVDGVPASRADGRAYNLHLYKSDGTYQFDLRSPLARPLTGATYRIHSTRTMSGPDFTTNTCQHRDPTVQTACLVHASPCSIGVAARSAMNEPGTLALKVNAVSNATSCVRSFEYPLARKLYLNTLVGFENVTGQELSLAQCFAGTGLSGGATLDSMVTAQGFVPLGVAPYCEDFNEVALCGAAGPNTNACANNPGTLQGAATSTTCGNGAVERFEECDDGPLNGTAGHCTTTCRFPIP